jgi:threonine dehydrogenase-like Zn-dependent dehydrogenase
MSNHTVQHTNNGIAEDIKPETYKAAVLAGPGKILFKDLKIPEILPVQLLIKMEGCGLCASSIPVWEGREWFSYPRPEGEPGHEGWGRVVERGNHLSKFHIGERVAVLQGNAFAEFVSVNEEDAIKLPVELGNIPFPGEAMGCLMNILDRADIKAGQTVAVLGLGFIGMGLLQLLKNKGVRIIAVSRRKEPFTQVDEFADHCIQYNENWEAVEAINKITKDQGCERVIECTGHQNPLDIATDIIAEYGKLIIAGYHQDGLRSVNIQKWNWKAIDVINAHERDHQRYLQGIESAVEASVSGHLNPSVLLNDAYPFEELEAAMENLAAGKADLIKSYIYF